MGAGIESYPGNRTVKDAIRTDLVDDLTELFSAINAIAGGSGVKVSANDTTIGVLNGKLLAGNGIVFTENNDGSNETLTISGGILTCANEAALGTGSSDGEMKVCTDNGNRYTWDDGNTKWRICSGNLYAADPSASVYTIETGTWIYNTSSSQKKVYDGTYWAGSLHPMAAPGYFQRSKMIFGSTSTITFDPGVYHHAGTKDQLVYWNAQFTYTITAGGTDFVFFYIDDSAIVTNSGNPVITATQIVDSTTVPSWSASARAWMNGNDRCIGMGYLSSGSLREFIHAGGTFVQYADAITEVSDATPSNVWTDQALTIPDICTEALCQLSGQYVGASAGSPQYRTKGQSGSSGHSLGYVSSSMTRTYLKARLITNGSQTIQIRFSNASATNTYDVATDGFFLPVGM